MHYPLQTLHPCSFCHRLSIPCILFSSLYGLCFSSWISLCYHQKILLTNFFFLTFQVILTCLTQKLVKISVCVCHSKIDLSLTFLTNFKNFKNIQWNSVRNYTFARLAQPFLYNMQKNVKLYYMKLLWKTDFFHIHGVKSKWFFGSSFVFSLSCNNSL